MSNKKLEIFIDQVCAAGEITVEHVRHLQRDLLPDGLMGRDEVDLLVALDRAVPKQHAAWSGFIIQAVVDFVVWSSRPTGHVDAEMASWLIASLSAGRGPTPVAEAIAFEVMREAEHSDEALLGFVMRAASGRMQVVDPIQKAA